MKLRASDYFNITLWLIVPMGLGVAAAIVYGSRAVSGPRLWTTVCVPATIGLISFGLGSHLALKHAGTGNYNPFKKAFEFFLLQGRSAMLIGSGIASFMVAYYFFLAFASPVGQEDVAERFGTAVGIYTGVLTLFIAGMIFYDRVAPITSLTFLLRSLIHDLKNEANGSLWFVYPQLNLGQYTFAKANEPDLFDNFREALETAMRRLKQQAALVTICHDESHAFWIAYLKGTADLRGDEELDQLDSTDDRVKRVSELCSTARDIFGYNAQSNTAPRKWEVPDHSFPPHVIVIGEIVYQITSFGLPIRDKAGSWQASAEYGSAKLLVYRRVDRDLAERIGSHMNELVKGYNAVPPQLPGIEKVVTDAVAAD